MTTSASTVTADANAMPALRQRFVDNCAPIVFSYKGGGAEAERQLRHLVGWPGEWIGYDVDTPDAASIVRAEDLLRNFRRVAGELGDWREPHVSAGQDGEIVLEWWSANRKATLYVSANSVDCIRVWGPNVDTQMDELPIHADEHVRNVWSWLNA